MDVEADLITASGFLLGRLRSQPTFLVGREPANTFVSAESEDSICFSAASVDKQLPNIYWDVKVAALAANLIRNLRFFPLINPHQTCRYSNSPFARIHYLKFYTAGSRKGLWKP